MAASVSGVCYRSVVAVGWLSGPYGGLFTPEPAEALRWCLPVGPESRQAGCSLLLEECAVSQHY